MRIRIEQRDSRSDRVTEGEVLHFGQGLVMWNGAQCPVTSVLLKRDDKSIVLVHLEPHRYVETMQQVNAPHVVPIIPKQPDRCAQDDCWKRRVGLSNYCREHRPRAERFYSGWFK